MPRTAGTPHAARLCAFLLFATPLLVPAAASAQGFCGARELTTVMEAYDLFYSDEIESAREVVTEALRTGEVPPYERATALILLAQTQLRMGQPVPAAINYRRAIAHDPDHARFGTRVGLAYALELAGFHKEAREEAEGFVEEVCSADGPSQHMACYGAHTLLSRMTEDATAMYEHLRASESHRATGHGDDAAYERFRELLEPADEAIGPTVAAAGEPGAG